MCCCSRPKCTSLHLDAVSRSLFLANGVCILHIFRHILMFLLKHFAHAISLILLVKTMIISPQSLPLNINSSSNER